MNASSRPSSSRLSRFVERCADSIMRHRRILLTLCLAVTVALGWSATRLRLDPGFNKMIPMQPCGSSRRSIRSMLTRPLPT